MKELNADIQDLANKDIFKDAAPKLFGNGFERTAKERAEAVKLLKEVRLPQKPQVHKPFFQTNCHPIPSGEVATNLFGEGNAISSFSLNKIFKRSNPNKETMSISSNCTFRHSVCRQRPASNFLFVNNTELLCKSYSNVPIVYKRNFLCSTHSSSVSTSASGQKIPPLPGEGKLLPIHLPPLLSIMCPLGLYQDPKASDGYAQRARGEASVLYRRHSGDG